MAVTGVRKAAGGRLWVHTAELQSGTIELGQQVVGGRRRRSVWAAEEL
jgi:hypothetical protein